MAPKNDDDRENVLEYLRETLLANLRSARENSDKLFVLGPPYFERATLNERRAADALIDFLSKGQTS